MTIEWILPALKEAYKHREEIGSAWAKIAAYLSSRKRTLAFTGMAGAGKTVLFDFITGKGFNPGYEPPGTSGQPEKGRLNAAKKSAKIVTIPGQVSPPRLDAIEELKDTDNLQGIIHVVSNGFDEIRDPVARNVLVQKGIRSVEDLRKYALQQELEDLTTTCHIVQDLHKKDRRPAWMLVVATKCDLYYGKLMVAQKRYSPKGKGPFVEKMRELQSQLGANYFDWSAMPCCSVLEHFQWNGAEVKSDLLPAARDHYIAQLAIELEKRLV